MKNPFDRDIIASRRKAGMPDWPGQKVTVLPASSPDGVAGPARVIRVESNGDNYLVSMLEQNWEGWIHQQRIKLND